MDYDSDSSLTDLSDHESSLPLAKSAKSKYVEADSDLSEEEGFEEVIVAAEDGEPKSKKRRRSTAAEGEEDSDLEYKPGGVTKRRKPVKKNKKNGKKSKKEKKEKNDKPLTEAQQKKREAKILRDAIKRDEAARIERETVWKQEMAQEEEAGSWKEGQKIHLFDMPPELLDMMFSLDQGYSIKDYMALSATCWTLRAPLQNDELWKAIYMLNGPGKIDAEFLGVKALDIELAVHNDRVKVKTNMVPKTELQAQPEDYAYKRYHVDPLFERPPDRTPEGLSHTTLMAYNLHHAERFPVPFKHTIDGKDWGYWKKRLDQLLEEMDPERRAAFVEAVRWGMQQACFGNQDVQLDEQGKRMDRPIRIRRFEYGIWHMLAIFATNVSDISSRTCILKKFMLVDEVKLFTPRPIVLPHEPERVGSAYIDDFVKKHRRILDDRKARRQPILKARNIKVKPMADREYTGRRYWYRRYRTKATDECFKCKSYHYTDYKGCIYWFNSPDDPDYDPAVPVGAIAAKPDALGEDKEDENEGFLERG